MKFSVVTITRNNLPELKETVASVLEQTERDCEFLIIDGQSTDATLEFLQELPPSVRWISEPDDGIADAFNKGLRLALGDMVIFLNSGDTFVERTTLADVAAAIPEGTEITEVVIYGDFVTVGKSETLLVKADHRNLQKTNTINHQSAFTGRRICARLRYDPRLILGMDYDYWLQCLSQGVTFIKVPVPVARFQLTGRSSDPRFRLHNELIRFFLRGLNARRLLTFADFLSLVRIGLRTEYQITIRKLIPPGIWLGMKKLLKSSNR